VHGIFEHGNLALRVRTAAFCMNSFGSGFINGHLRGASLFARGLYCNLFLGKVKNRMAKMIKKTLKKIDKVGDVPVTQAQFEAFSAEMKSILTTHKLEFRGMEKRTDARFAQVDARFDQIDARFVQLELSLLSSIESLTAAVHRTNAIVEEQNARNKFVIDGYKKATFGIET
jgi:hypothetical protein